MPYQDFEEIVRHVQNFESPPKIAVVAAEDHPVMEAVLMAEDNKLIKSILIGKVSRIKEILRSLNRNPSDFYIESAENEIKAADTGVRLIREEAADYLMKGHIESQNLLKPVVNMKSGLNLGRTMSHFGLHKLPSYKKLIGIADGGMILYPTLKEKRDIIINSTEVFHDLGYRNPKIAVMAGIEKINPKMIETVDAAKLAEMSKNGLIKGSTVVGPLSYDIAMCPKIAAFKNYNCGFCGDFDMLIVPSLAAGNLLSKSWTITSGALFAGIIVGARVPIVLTSRSSSAKEKFYSIALASHLSRKEAKINNGRENLCH